MWGKARLKWINGIIYKFDLTSCPLSPSVWFMITVWAQMNVSLGQSASLCLCVYARVSHLAVERPVKWMNEYSGSIFHFLFGALAVAMLFLWAVRNNELFQVAIRNWQSVARVGNVNCPTRGSKVKKWSAKNKIEQLQREGEQRVKRWLEMPGRTREPGCRGALPAVCVVYAFQPGGSKPGKRRAHTLNAHQQTYTTIPRSDIYRTEKHIICTILNSLKNTHIAWLVSDRHRFLKCFDLAQGRTKP